MTAKDTRRYHIDEMKKAAGWCRQMIAHIADPTAPEWSTENAAENAATFAARAATHARLARLIDDQPTLL